MFNRNNDMYIGGRKSANDNSVCGALLVGAGFVIVFLGVMWFVTKRVNANKEDKKIKQAVEKYEGNTQNCKDSICFIRSRNELEQVLKLVNKQ
ncbi:MAG: hypothetical protein K5912_03485, partial [Alphaproteobacteria bacterium]|nr:hypothetical protein [Alphaproteobacteria bacterium]